MHDREIHKVVKILKSVVQEFSAPAVTQVSEKTRDPFKVLISCILSLRTKDKTTLEASKRLFKIASTPQKMRAIPLKTIEKAIYPVGFYRVKTKNIKGICRELVERYNSKVPDTIDELLKLKGVGRKTANLVVTLGYGKAGICVDTHVHRITNRWGYVKTKTPEETEFALRKKLPKKYWLIINDMLVQFGQNICKPISPLCSKCRLFSYCGRVDVLKSR
ncbi:MAG: endonuclease III [Deltaproteobacteria bacterium]|nr:endonuclease III [Deltaproteobacteria bacterium]